MSKNQKGFTVIEGLIILVVLLVVGGLTWFFIDKNNSQPKTVADVLSSISDDTKSTYSNASFDPTADWSAEASATSFNKVAGYDFAVSGGVGKGIVLSLDPEGKPKSIKKFWFIHKTVPPAKGTYEVENLVKSDLTKYGYKSVDLKSFTKGGTTCIAANNSALYGQVSENSGLFQVNCFGGDVLKEDAAQMQPFVTEYLKAHPNLKASDLTVGPLTIKSKNGSGVIGSSHAAGYDIAEMLVRTKTNTVQIALYYAKNADIFKGTNSGWHYVTEANDEFGFKCGDMAASPDSRKAFYDQVCLSAHGQVRLDTNNRALQ